MMDAAKRLKEFAQELTLLSRVLEVPFSWHFENPDHLRAVPEEQRQCWSRFCLKTRSRHRFMLDKCLRDHRNDAFRSALLKRYGAMAADLKKAVSEAGAFQFGSA